ncbi:hypothetical protein [Pseudoponticoccus marisrubri]|uniref:Uncharacterized protein n=1 Tax=Pseudoponticoccus marisrubri TaxID=1685382 RepID=A0A0W7WKV9_9RHOB|nr:hypothetical protein [Pseudoponticoccus marisrubri]KUF11156.1 hypothetical protein AVJ23_08870 [Pseudoponticoccus marisrubri]
MLRLVLIASLGFSVGGCGIGGGGGDGFQPFAFLRGGGGAAEPASPASMDNPPRRTGDNVARKLTPGVTKPEVDVALGNDAGYERNPADFDEACASYNYGTADSPKYVHAVFRNGQLQRATDGHLVLCSYDSAAGAES